MNTGTDDRRSQRAELEMFVANGDPGSRIMSLNAAPRSSSQSDRVEGGDLLHPSLCTDLTLISLPEDGGQINSVYETGFSSPLSLTAMPSQNHLESAGGEKQTRSCRTMSFVSSFFYFLVQNC